MGPEIALFSCQEVGDEKRGFALHGVKGDFGIPTIHSCLLSTFAFTATTEAVSHSVNCPGGEGGEGVCGETSDAWSGPDTTVSLQV